MGSSRERSLRELYADDPDRADRLVLERETHPDRRGFLGGAGLAALGTVLGAAIPFHRNFPSGLVPVAFAEDEGLVLAGKDGLRILNDRPVNAETPAHLLNDDVTPTVRHFVRNNGIPPESTAADGWVLTVDGEVEHPLKLAPGELRERFEVVTLRLQLECGGNGRAGFNPPASGNQWTTGAIGNAEWTGVRYGDVLKAAGLKESARYTGHYGADRHLSGDPARDAISRGVPLEKALEPHTLIAFAMNGAPIHPQNGAPIRVVAPGWPGSVSQKWLTRIRVRDRVHDGEKMGGMSYRIPAYPVAPGAEIPEADFRIIEAMPVKSLITYPRSGVTLASGLRAVEVRGHAWVGEGRVSAVHLSRDFGASWTKAELSDPPNLYSWQRWRARLTLPMAGYYEIWARATDEHGVMQPFTPPWNPRGYLNNAMHRIAVRIAA